MRADNARFLNRSRRREPLAIEQSRELSLRLAWRFSATTISLEEKRSARGLACK
jgi:hypothetical protein